MKETRKDKVINSLFLRKKIRMPRNYRNNHFGSYLIKNDDRTLNIRRQTIICKRYKRATIFDVFHFVKKLCQRKLFKSSVTILS